MELPGSTSAGAYSERIGSAATAHIGAAVTSPSGGYRERLGMNGSDFGYGPQACVASVCAKRTRVTCVHHARSSGQLPGTTMIIVLAFPSGSILCHNQALPASDGVDGCIAGKPTI